MCVPRSGMPLSIADMSFCIYAINTDYVLDTRLQNINVEAVCNTLTVGRTMLLQFRIDLLVLPGRGWGVPCWLYIVE